MGEMHGAIPLLQHRGHHDTRRLSQLIHANLRKRSYDLPHHIMMTRNIYGTYLRIEGVHICTGHTQHFKHAQVTAPARLMCCRLLLRRSNHTIISATLASTTPIGMGRLSHLPCSRVFPSRRRLRPRSVHSLHAHSAPPDGAGSSPACDTRAATTSHVSSGAVSTKRGC